MMDKDPENRIASAKELISTIDDRWHSTPDQDHNRQKSLADFMKGKEKPKPTALSRYAVPRSQQMLWAAVAATVVLASLVVGLVYLVGPEKPSPGPPSPQPVVSDSPEPAEDEPEDERPIPEPEPAESPKDKMRKQYLAKAKKAYEKAVAYEEEHSEDLDGRWRTWRDYLADFDKSPDAEKARERMDRVSQEMNQRAFDRFSVAVADAEIQAAKGAYFTGIAALQEYTKGSYDPKIKEKAGVLITKYRRGYEADFNRAKTAGERALKEERYANAIRAYQGFIEGSGGGPRATEMKALLQQARKKMNDDYAASMKEVSQRLDNFDFQTSELRLQSLSTKFEGTPVAPQIQAMRSAASNLGKLHSAAVAKIRAADSPKVLSFGIDLGGAKVHKGKPITATEKRVTIDFRELNIQQDLLWTKFTKEQVFQIYRMYLDERIRQNRSLLSVFAKQFKVKSRYYQPPK
jgi:hypothetical protein